MADQDDFAAYTTIGDRVAPALDRAAPKHPPAQGPSFALPPKLEASRCRLARTRWWAKAARRGARPFVLLAKSVRGAGAADVITKATAAPGVYVFSELLDQKSIQDLASHDQHAAQYRLLELFAYGTWADYDTKRDDYPPLSPEQETKLKHLTILSLATESRVIPYATLLSLLALPSLPALEDLLISAFYANVLTGRLDQREQRLEVLSAQGRDVRPSPSRSAAVPAADESMQLDAPSSAAPAPAPAQTTSTLLSSLVAFQRTLAALLDSLNAHVQHLHAASVAATERAAAHERRVRAAAEAVHSNKDGAVAGKKGGARGGAAAAAATATGAGEGEMDVDGSGSAAGFGAAGAAGGQRGNPGGPQGGRTRKRGRT
ncbi:hypothetical protein Rhopal_005383-T1 [Rhodotorula paludigena]|uniref:PCI domain-containing protein n=1 Tax=Rhodotorula paludigena TaxID=86838 RepID=A0AAV5GQA3_9BASI|nr:hypothetical protein Rhopal_005383-T1 [Rhodotorula paludigena]